ncbi:hypothetical protein [Marinitenerispora sediminis]|nr:hypothetical protein [Marinitenerispora sediminis]
MQNEYDDELMIAAENINAVRARGEQPSDGGGTGKSDMNDNALR